MYKKKRKRVHSDNSLPSYDLYGWPVRSVERLPPYSPKQLKYPVLLIGNTVRVFTLQAPYILTISTGIHRLTPSRHLRKHEGSPARSIVLSCSSNSVSVTRLWPKPLLAPGVSLEIMSPTPRSVVLLIRIVRVFMPSVPVIFSCHREAVASVSWMTQTSSPP